MLQTGGLGVHSQPSEWGFWDRTRLTSITAHVKGLVLWNVRGSLVLNWVVYTRHVPVASRYLPRLHPHTVTTIVFKLLENSCFLNVPPINWDHRSRKSPSTPLKVEMRVIITPVVYPRLDEPLHFDIQSTGQKSHCVNIAMLCFN